MQTAVVSLARPPSTFVKELSPRFPWLEIIGASAKQSSYTEFSGLHSKETMVDRVTLLVGASQDQQNNSVLSENCYCIFTLFTLNCITYFEWSPPASG